MSAIDIRIFPVSVKYNQFTGKVEKRPQVDNWQNPLNTVSLSELDAGENYGVLCGGPSNLVVIDFDKGSKLRTVDGLHADTLVVRTQSGGRHFYFTCDDADKIKSKTGLAKNVDVRAKGGFVVGPGSGCITPDGEKKYFIETGDWNSIAPIPYELFQMLRREDFLISEKKQSDVINRTIRENTELDVETVRDALKHINLPAGGDYAMWFTVCAALQTEDLFAEFVEWSMTQPGFVSITDCQKQWTRVSSKRVSNGLSIGSIFHLAKATGWEWKRKKASLREETDLNIKQNGRESF